MQKFLILSLFAVCVGCGSDSESKKAPAASTASSLVGKWEYLGRRGDSPNPKYNLEILGDGTMIQNAHVTTYKHIDADRYRLTAGPTDLVYTFKLEGRKLIVSVEATFISIEPGIYSPNPR